MTVTIDAFSTDPGIDSGRIIPKGVVPADGDYVFCLGHDSPGFTGFLSEGSYVEISKTSPFPSNTTRFSFLAVSRIPPPPFLGAYWQLDVLINDEPVSTQFPQTGNTSFDWVIDVSHYTSDDAPHPHLMGSGPPPTLAFRLTFQSSGRSNPNDIPFFEVEIPAFYIDNLVFVLDTDPICTNEYPVPNQGINVFSSLPVPNDVTGGPPPPLNTGVSFDLFAPHLLIDPDSITVTFNMTGGSLGGLGLMTTPLTNGVPTSDYGDQSDLPSSADEAVHVLLQADVFTFPSACTVEVDVSYNTLENTGPYSHSWSFTVADTAPPLMQAIIATDTNKIEISWNKEIALSDPAGDRDGLNPSMYYVEGIAVDTVTPFVNGGPTGPAVFLPAPYITVTNVAIIFSDPGDPYSQPIIELTLSDDLSPGVNYYLTELGVSDLFGNCITSVGAFVAFTPPGPRGRQLDLYRMLPLLNRQEDLTQDLLRLINCLQDPTNLLLYGIDIWPRIFNVAQAPDAFLTAMLADMGNPFPFPLSTESKRQLLLILVSLYQQFGTGVGIINAIRFFTGYEVTIGTYDSSGNWSLGESTLGEDSMGTAMSGNSGSIISKSSGIIGLGYPVTFDAVGTSFGSAQVGLTIHIWNAADTQNVGSFTIASVTSATELIYYNDNSGSSPTTPDSQNGSIGWYIPAAPGSAGTCVLGPGTSRIIYSFTVVMPIDTAVLPPAVAQQIDFIANYMKPANTHYLGIVYPSSAPSTYSPIELDISELGVDWILGD